MNTVIINEPLEILELTPGNNETLILTQKRRARIIDGWNTKIIILNRREALAIHKAITDNILSPRRYSIASLRR